VLAEVAVCRHPMAYDSLTDSSMSKDILEGEGLSVAGVPMGGSHDYYELSTADLWRCLFFRTRKFHPWNFPLRQVERWFWLGAMFNRWPDWTWRCVLAPHGHFRITVSATPAYNRI